MDISINEEYKITSDPMNIIVSRRTKDKETGEFTDNYKPIGFCKDVEQAALFLLNHNITNNDAETFGELIQVVKDSREQIIKAIEGAMNNGSN